MIRLDRIITDKGSIIISSGAMSHRNDTWKTRKGCQAVSTRQYSSCVILY